MRKLSLKRFFLYLLLLVLFISANADHISSVVPASCMLKSGLKGERVKQLQYSLKELGFFNGTPTAYFGENTKKAVEDFQRYFELEPDGIAGFFTLSEVERLRDRNMGGISPVRVVIDPGHGGIDPGTSNNSLAEKDINLEIAERLQRYLKRSGTVSVLTRNTDRSLCEESELGDTAQERDLNARTRIINRNQAELFISIHVNSCPGDRTMEGPVVYYNQYSLQSKRLAENIQKELNSIRWFVWGHKYNRPTVENFYVLRFANIPGVLVETAFITNKNDRKLLASDSFKERTARAIVKGIKKSGLLK